MASTPQLLGAMLVLASGTFLLRLAGPALRARITLPGRVEKLLEVSTVVLLTALMTVTTLTEARDFAGVARLAGVLVGGLLAWRKAPFLAVVLAAAATTALLRLAGAR